MGDNSNKKNAEKAGGLHLNVVNGMSRSTEERTLKG